MSITIRIFQKVTNQLRLSLSTRNTFIFAFFKLLIIIFSDSFDFKIFNFIKDFEHFIRATSVEKIIYKNSIDSIITSED